MSEQMDEIFAASLRELLVTRVSGTHAGRAPVASPRWAIRAGAIVALVAGGGGVAYGTGVFATTPPGGPVITHLAPAVTVTGTGNGTVRLGPQPARTNAIAISFTCLSAGTFRYAGEAETCGGPDAGRSTATSTTPTAPGRDSISVTATPGARWRLTATYATVTTSAWGVNASGQTYGTANRYGIPDLIAVQATNGKDGYVYAYQLYPPGPKTPKQAVAQNHAPPTRMTVYESDGKTPIGEFISGEGPANTATNASTVPTRLPDIKTLTTEP